MRPLGLDSLKACQKEGLSNCMSSMMRFTARVSITAVRRNLKKSATTLLSELVLASTATWVWTRGLVFIDESQDSHAIIFASIDLGATRRSACKKMVAICALAPILTTDAQSRCFLGVQRSDCNQFLLRSMLLFIDGTVRVGVDRFSSIQLHMMRRMKNGLRNHQHVMPCS